MGGRAYFLCKRIAGVLPMRIAIILLATAFVAQPVRAQGFSEYGGINALSAGLGAGLAGSLSHGRVVQQSYDAMVQAQQMAAAQTQEIKVYFSQALDFEKKKQWAYAEQTWGYILRLIARRDGPGSPESLPVLSHLSHVLHSEKKLDQAITYQKTVVAMTKAARKPDAIKILDEQRTLSGLYMEKKDYPNAALALKQEVALFDKYPSLPRDQYQYTMSVYGKLLQDIYESNPTAAAANSPSASPSIVPPSAVTSSGETAAVQPVQSAAAPAVNQATQPAAPEQQAPALQFDFPDQAQPLTADQAKLEKNNLAGSQPLPSELNMVQTMVATQHLTPAQEDAIYSNVPGLRPNSHQANIPSAANQEAHATAAQTTSSEPGYPTVNQVQADSHAP